MIKNTNIQKEIPRKGTVRASDPFRRFKPEPTHQVRKPDVKENEKLRTIKLAWLRLCENLTGDLETPYERAVELVRSLEYSAKDVEGFSLMLPQLQTLESSSHYDGLFLSALINMGKEQDYIIHTIDLYSPLNFLGYENIKNITVNGDVGLRVGNRMKKGTITINGNAGTCVGELMRGGKIIVNGKTDQALGGPYGNEGGEIHLNGDFDLPSHAHMGSDIYHNGKLIHSMHSWPMLSCMDYWWRTFRH